MQSLNQLFAMQSKQLTYLGRVSENGEIKLPKRLRAEVSAFLAGCEIEAIFRKKKKYRTNPQLRYYFGVIVPIICDAFAELGNPVSSSNPKDLEDVHDFLKKRFLQPDTLVDANGEVHVYRYTTTTKSTSEMMDYFAQIGQFAAEYLNTVIPDPNEQAEINF